jgi:AcrR family transcriptional regulator
VSRGERPERLLDAAATLGIARGVGALSVQAIATAAGVSKALVLYHFSDKAALYTALARQLATQDAEAMRGAAQTSDPMVAWRTMATAGHGARALLGALLLEPPVHGVAPALTAEREAAATELGVAMLRALDLTPRIAPQLVGRLLVRQLDGLGAAQAARDALTAHDAELDAFALALLTLAD